MAISVIKEPTALMFCDNDMYVSLSSSKVFTTLGLYPTSTLTFATACTAGDTITIKSPILPNDIVFTCATTPDDSGTQFPEFDGIETVDQYVDRILPFFLANYQLYLKFNIFKAATNIIGFKGLARGNAYKLTGSTTSGVFASFSIPGADADPVIAQNFRLLIDLYVSDAAGTTFTRLNSAVLTPNINKVDFNLAPLLRAILHDSYSIPSTTSGTAELLTDCIRQYYYRAVEQYGNIPTEYAAITSSTKRVLRGGFKHEYFDATQNIDTNWLNHNTSFLSFLPGSRKISSNQPLYVTFYNFYKAHNYYFQCILKYTDGTTSIHNALDSAYVKDKVYRIPCGIPQLFLDGVDPTKNIAEYDVRVYDYTDSVIVAGPITFVLEDEDYLDEFMGYISSSGAFEVVRLQGGVVYNLRFQSEQVEHMNTAYDASTSYAKSFNTQFDELYEHFSGYVNRDEILYMTDLLVSPAVYLLKDNSWIPVVLEADEHTMLDDDSGRYLYSVKLKYTVAYPAQKTFSPEPVFGAQTLDPDSADGGGIPVDGGGGDAGGGVDGNIGG